MQRVSVRRRRRERRRLPGRAAVDDGVVASDHQARETLATYLAQEDDPKPLKLAAVLALVAHFVLFFIVVPSTELEPIRMDERSAAMVVKRFKPPAAPTKARKTRKKKSANPLPIPDPTPREPEPIYEEASDIEFGELDTEFVAGQPEGPPGPSGARAGAVGIGDSGLIAPIPLEKPLPEYTPTATRSGVQGEVYIEAVVTVDGTVVEPKLIRGLPDEELNQRAMEAIQRWRFKPGIKDGRPVPVIALFTVTFRIH